MGHRVHSSSTWGPRPRWAAEGLNSPDPACLEVGTGAWSGVASRFDVGPALFLQFHHAHDA
jgi:hypothetical protein